MKLKLLALGLASALCVWVAPALPAEAAKQAWSPRQPSWPALDVNREPELCAATLRREEVSFASEKGVARKMFLQLSEFEEVNFGEGTSFERGSAFRKDLDLDGDGTAEHVLITISYFRDQKIINGYIAARPSDVTLLLNSNNTDWQSTLPNGISRFPREEALITWNSARDSRIDWYTRVLPLYRWKNQFYFAGLLQNSAESGLALYQLKGDGSTPLICLVRSAQAAPITESMLRAPEIKALVKSLAAIGTSSRSYCGTLNAGGRHDHWAWGSVDRAAVRPWVDPASEPDIETKSRYHEYSPRMWRFLEAWALNDVWSKREYQTLLQTMGPARRAYANYLSREFGLDDRAARVKGDVALERMIASWFLISYDFEEWPASEDSAAAPDFSRVRISLDPSEINRFGKTNLMMAAHMNRLDLVRELLKRGGNPDAITQRISECGYFVERAGRTALSYAAENGSPLVMKVLLDAGASPNAKDVKGNTLEYYLQRNPRLSVAQRKLPIAELAATATHLADAPGFDCARARRRTERAICASEALRLLDSEMTEAYGRALGIAGAALQADQKRWVAWREKDCVTSSGDDYTECLADSTAARERFLHYFTAETEAITR